MTGNGKNYKKILHSYGLKVTEARIKVLDVLSESPAALSHVDITSRLTGHNIDKVTLYRTLNAFTICGLAHKVANEERNWLYALQIDNNAESISGSDHAHFICNKCERIYCLPVSFDYNKPVIENTQGFLITSHEYRLHGMCPNCN